MCYFEFLLVKRGTKRDDNNVRVINISHPVMVEILCCSENSVFLISWEMELNKKVKEMRESHCE